MLFSPLQHQRRAKLLRQRAQNWPQPKKARALELGTCPSVNVCCIEESAIKSIGQNGRSQHFLLYKSSEVE